MFFAFCIDCILHPLRSASMLPGLAHQQHHAKPVLSHCCLTQSQGASPMYLCRCARLLLQNALSPFAVPAGLGPTVHCCTLALLYCTALETSHSLMLSPRLMSDLWPTCEQVMHALHYTHHSRTTMHANAATLLPCSSCA